MSRDTCPHGGLLGSAVEGRRDERGPRRGSPIGPDADVSLDPPLPFFSLAHLRVAVSERLFHVDRRGDLAPGDEIVRETVPAGTVEERALLAAVFDGGVAPHGRHYCEMDLYADDVDALWDATTELLFELVRRERFPWRPSRFRSVFAFASREDAVRFVARYGEEPATVFEVSGVPAFSADMRMVDAPTVPGGVRRAHYYWEGLTDRDDPLWEVLVEPPVTVERTVATVAPDVDADRNGAPEDDSDGSTTRDGKSPGAEDGRATR